jgi:hypothetical protein
MCFSMEMSAAFAAVGLFATYWIYSRTSNTALASGVFFFFAMEVCKFELILTLLVVTSYTILFYRG